MTLVLAPMFLVIYCFTFHSRILHLNRDDTITAEGLQKLGLCSALMAGRDLYRGTPAVTWHLVFSGVIRKTALFNRLARGCR
jgi:hypothetical protein